jgi:hypothetical protein
MGTRLDPEEEAVKDSAPVVYHFTDTLALPWIIESGALRPHAKLLVGIGRTDAFVWATTNPAGDKTARAMVVAAGGEPEEALKQNRYRLVRLTLRAKSFRPWAKVVRKEGWTPGQLAELADDDYKRGCEVGYQDQWRVRSTRLPLANVLKAEAKTFAGPWRRIELDPGQVVRTENPNFKGYRLGRKTLFAMRMPRDDVLVRGDSKYAYRPELNKDEFADIAYAARREAEEARAEFEAIADYDWQHGCWVTDD